MAAGRPLRAVLFGLGGVGCAVAKALADKASVDIVAAVDIDPAKIGRDVADVAGLGAETGVAVSAALPEGLDADVVIHASVPHIRAIADELEMLVTAGLNVVSISGAFYIANQYPDIAARIDAAARAHGVSVYATGGTPGFFPDVLPVFATRVCTDVKSVDVTRVVDMAQWGAGVYTHYGIGLAKPDFDARVASGELKLFDRLRQSIDYIAASLSWDLDFRREEKIARTTDYRRMGNGIVIEPGHVCGFTHKHIGSRAGDEVVTVDYTAVVGIDSAADDLHEQTRIVINGTPPMTLDVSGEIMSDPYNIYVVTAAIAINSIPCVIAARPGLVTPRDLPMMTPIS